MLEILYWNGPVRYMKEVLGPQGSIPQRPRRLKGPLS